MLVRNPVTASLAYLLLAAIAWVAAWNGSGPVTIITTILALAFLSVWFFFSTRRYGDRFTLLVQAALFFSLLGYTAFTYVEQDGFAVLVSLGAIILAQFCFTLAFGNNIFQVPGPVGLPVGIPLAVVSMAFMAFFSNDVLARVEEDLYPPVLVSLIIMALMGAAAGLRFHRTYMRSFWTVLLGSVALTASTCLLLTDRFIRPIDHALLWVLLSAMTGLYLVALGCIAHVRTPTHVRRQEVLST